MLAMVDAARQSGRTDPVPGREVPGVPKYASAPFNAAVPAALRYHPKTKPRGVRGNVYDAARNVYGSIRGPASRSPFDNVGVQYGLQALNAGASAQAVPRSERGHRWPRPGCELRCLASVGDRGAIRRAYQSGLQFAGSGGLARFRWSTWRASTTKTLAITTVVPLRRRASAWRANTPHRQPRQVARQHALCRAWNMFITWVDACGRTQARAPCTKDRAQQAGKRG